MTLGGVRPGDIVLCDVRGARFHALVAGREDGRLIVEPIQRGFTYRTVTARGVRGIWRAAGRRKAQTA